MHKSSNPNKKDQNKQIFKNLKSARNRLHHKLNKLDIESLNISKYNKQYLRNKLNNLNASLELYAHIIFLALKNNVNHVEDFVIIDYGGGSGIMSFLAAEMGVGTVIYNDIYKVSCEDVNNISQVLDLKLDHIICGDVDDLANFLKDKNLNINALVSYDVLEHIYDVNYHFDILGQIQEKSFQLVYASGANIANPLYVNKIKKVQISTELEGQEKMPGYKERDTHEAFLEVRKKIISNYAPTLEEAEVKYLASATRGLIKNDIKKYIDEYQMKGKISYQIHHPTNTCDPYTGNWCEHLISHRKLLKTIKKNNFYATILPGKYNTAGPMHKKLIKLFINVLFQLGGRKFIFLAPYYIVKGNKMTN